MESWAWIVVAVAGIGAVGIGGLAVVDLVRGILAAGEAERKVLEAKIVVLRLECEELRGQVERLQGVIATMQAQSAQQLVARVAGDQSGQAQELDFIRLAPLPKAWAVVGAALGSALERRWGRG